MRAGTGPRCFVRARPGGLPCWGTVEARTRPDAPCRASPGPMIYGSCRVRTGLKKHAFGRALRMRAFWTSIHKTFMQWYCDTWLWWLRSFLPMDDGLAYNTWMTV
jgi:hypothetical protein